MPEPEWQWSATLPELRSPETLDHPRAFLYIPPTIGTVRGVVIGQHNMLEEPILEHPAVRRGLAAAGMAAIWVTPAFDGNFNFTANPEAPAHFQRMMNDLAAESGYPELSQAPVVWIGHSAMASAPYHFAAWDAHHAKTTGAPRRAAAAISIKGWFPGDHRPENPAYTDSDLAGIPILFVNGEYEDAHGRAGKALEFRNRTPGSILSMVADTGGGHFDWNDKICESIGMYLRKLGQVRLPATAAPDGTATLREIEPSRQGWLADRWRKGTPPAANPAPVGSYQGNPAEAFWYFDGEHAESTQLGQLPVKTAHQLLAYTQDGKPVDQRETHQQVDLAFTPDPAGDGLTFKLGATFLDSVPKTSSRLSGWTGLPAGSPIGHSHNGPIRIQRICGPVEQLSVDTFRIRFNRVGTANHHGQNRSRDIWLMSTHPGDESLSRAVQQALLRIPYPLKTGAPQTIDFPPIPDQSATTKSIRLTATTTGSTVSPGTMVDYYIREGPARINGSVLEITPIPRRARFPIKVTVVATQYGRTIPPLLQTADPVVRTFHLVRAPAHADASFPPSGIDMITFGDPASEKEHATAAGDSTIVTAESGETSRRLLAGSGAPWEGGSIEWTLGIDPTKQNHLTLKLWGSDKGYQTGRLILFANGLQVGYRHEGDHDLLNQCDDDPLAPGRFVYVTLPLPMTLTKGNESIRLKIVPTGPIWFYGNSFDKYQKPFTGPSRGIYRAYTHTSPGFDPSPSETQGAMPRAEFRPIGDSGVIEESRKVVVGRLSRMLANSGLPGNAQALAQELSVLADAWKTDWTPAHRNPATLERMVRLGDAFAADFHKDRSFVENDWSGARALGIAVISTMPDLTKDLRQDIEINGQRRSRDAVWAEVLKHSVEHWRHRRRPFTNQSMIVDAGIYTANRALELIAPSEAIDPARALGFLRQSAGIDPWLGSDTDDGGSEMPYGAGYRLVTRKGLSRELGYVGSYGETILPFMVEMATLSGDPGLREQTRRMQHARHVFRYPSFDADGHRCMKLVSEIDNRTAHYPHPGSAYNAPDVREAWWMETAALLPDDPAIVGAARQSVREGQYFHQISKRLKDRDTLGMMRNINHWEKVASLPQDGRCLPMTPGQPDFVFADEENAVLAVKHGEEMLFVNFYYRAERAVNRVARVFEITPRITRLATVPTEVEVSSSGRTYTRPDWVDRIRNRGITPPGQDLHQAWAGETMIVAKRPDDARLPAYGEWGPFVGKADFYSLRYRGYLIAMNTTEQSDRSITIPARDGPGRDLATGKWFAAGSAVPVPPLSTVVLLLQDPPERAH
jgi:hypothetical protein